MTEPNRPRPVPGPLRPGPWRGAAPVPAAAMPDEAQPDEAQPDEADTDDGRPFADLDRRPVAQHVAVFEAEHARLQRELGTIDQL
jgi:hypothetical protein